MLNFVEFRMRHVLAKETKRIEESTPVGKQVGCYTVNQNGYWVDGVKGRALKRDSFHPFYLEIYSAAS